ncbi:hypothetical protein ACGFY7_33455 [Streptomyces prunicolor]|uniref:hypothetical protein n=1 Tax=Streptomyces prunicolor TaxID=67348 RepID=UPI00371DD09F
MTGAIVLLAAPAAQANWTSYAQDWLLYKDSRHWDDEEYTEVKFTGCNTIQDSQTSIQIYRVINNWPDTGYGEKDFQKCFESGGTSTGVEYNLPTASYYFTIECIDGECTVIQLNNTLDVKTIQQDTTLAD